MLNIQLSYVYRDAGNYKNFGSVILANPANIELEAIESPLKKHLIDGCWFYTAEWHLPDLHFADIDQNDPTWHEFESIQYTDLPPNSALSLQEFMVLIEKIARPTM